MRTIPLIILIFAACGLAYQNKPGAGTMASSAKIIDTIHSKILNEDRYIWLHVPEPARNTTKKYPVLFVFDAEANFDATKKILDNLSKEPAFKSAGDVILVGIGHIWLRYRDYSPTRVDPSQWVDAPTAKTTGGGEKFVSFIEKELLPYIEKKYPVSSFRTLIGHSMGGLMVMHILLKHKELFDSYIAIDPSMWWDNNKLLNESVSILGSQSFDNKKLFLAIANEQDKKMTTDQIRKDTSAKTFLIRPSFLLVDLIEKNRQNGLRFQWKFYKDDHHMTVNTPATLDALKTILPSTRGLAPQP
ncbi:MAG TPA: alpha/beta fold hydrolase [Chitinophagaceae bacterium]